jgi:hypothetical protein
MKRQIIKVAVHIVFRIWIMDVGMDYLPLCNSVIIMLVNNIKFFFVTDANSCDNVTFLMFRRVDT